MENELKKEEEEDNKKNNQRYYQPILEKLVNSTKMAP
jgi:hypothetical protein